MLPVANVTGESGDGPRGDAGHLPQQLAGPSCSRRRNCVEARHLPGPDDLALMIGLARYGNMIIDGAAGAALPLFLPRVGIDPAVASVLAVSTLADVFGFLLFLGFASAAINLIRSPQSNAIGCELSALGGMGGYPTA